MKLTQLAESLMQTGLTPVMFMTLISIQCGCDNQADIARKIKASTATVCSSIFKMSQDGLLNMTRSKEDRRVVWLTLTEEGNLLLDRVTGTLTKLEKEARNDSRLQHCD